MSTRESPYRLERLQSEIEPEKESGSTENVPIIDVIRHGKTEYKELKDPNFAFTPESPDFKLDPEHLDLTAEGIQEIEQTADQLATLIDSDKEIILLVTSPNYRAQSSLLLIERRLKGAGISILNPGEKIYQTRSLRQIEHKNPRDMQRWIEQNASYRSRDPRHRTQPPDEAHQAIAEELGQKITDIFTEDYEGIDLRFQRFLRHMTNIEGWLQTETSRALEGKKLRIVCLTHEELPIRFMRETLQTKENLKNGQILEIQPTSQLSERGQNLNQVILYPKGIASENGKAEILRTFKIDKS